MTTNGWDTVFVATTAAANKAWAAWQEKRAPAGLPFTFSNDMLTLSGVFGVWQIAAGGSGTLLHVDVPIVAGSVTLDGGDAADIAGLIVTVAVPLALIPRADGSADVELRFDYPPQSAAPPSSADPVTEVVLQDPQNLLGIEGRIAMHGVFADCIMANAALLDYAIASLNPIAPGSPGWLAPRSSAFAYWETTDTPPVGYLAIMSATDDRDTSALKLTLDPEIMAAGGEAFIAISSELFLQHVVQPMLPAVFGQGATDASFAYVAESSATTPPTPAHLQNTGDIALDSVKPALIRYYPKLTSLGVAINGPTVQCSMAGNCDMGIGITMSFDGTVNNALAFDPATRALSFAADPNPSVNHSKHIPTEDFFFFLAGGLIALGIADAALAIIVPLVASSIARGIEGNASSLALASAPPATVQWTGLENFTVSAAKLNGALSLAGSFA